MRLQRQHNQVSYSLSTFLSLAFVARCCTRITVETGTTARLFGSTNNSLRRLSALSTISMTSSSTLIRKVTTLTQHGRRSLGNSTLLILPEVRRRVERSAWDRSTVIKYEHSKKIYRLQVSYYFRSFLRTFLSSTTRRSTLRHKQVLRHQ